MFKSLFSQKPKIKGIIGYLGLESFWLSCTPQEQDALTRYHQGGLGAAPGSSPIKGDVSYSSSTKLKYLSAMIGWAVSEKNYSLADKIISAGKDLAISEVELLDAHFFWQEAAECYYKQRDCRRDFATSSLKSMAARNYLTESISLYIGYSYTQGVPGTGGTATLALGTNLSSMVLPAVDVLFRRVVRQGYAIRQIGLSCPVYPDTGAYQLNMFENPDKQLRGKALQEALLSIRSKYGKNAILKGINFDPAATGRERNMQIGGHKSGSEGSKSTHAQK